MQKNEGFCVYMQYWALQNWHPQAVTLLARLEGRGGDKFARALDLVREGTRNHWDTKTKKLVTKTLKAILKEE